MNMGKWSAERISRAVFYLLLALTAVIGSLFYLVDYDRPCEEDPDFIEPQLTGLLIGLMLLLFVVAGAVTLWMTARAVRLRGKEAHTENNIPTRAISCTVTAFTTLLLVLTYTFGSSSALVSNGQPYTSVPWLKTADMFVCSSLSLITVAIMVMVFGLTRYHRKRP